jgi:hypothetical protein
VLPTYPNSDEALCERKNLLSGLSMGGWFWRQEHYSGVIDDGTKIKDLPVDPPKPKIFEPARSSFFGV